MEYNHERRKLRIATWIVVALLILSIIGASLLFALSNRTKNKTKQPNVVNVGDSISKNGTNNVTIPNASVWDGTSSTSWSGSGTASSPYLISTASQLAGLATNVNNGTTYAGKYFKLTSNLDMAGEGYADSTGYAYLDYETYKNYKVGSTFTVGKYTYKVISINPPSSSGTEIVTEGLCIAEPAGTYSAGDILQSSGDESVEVMSSYTGDMEMAGYTGWRLGDYRTITGQGISFSGYAQMVHESDFQSGGYNETDFTYINDSSMEVYDIMVNYYSGSETDPGSVYCSYTYQNGKAFTSIGTSSTKYFGGNFDGDGHIIGNLATKYNSSIFGLFGYVNSTGGAVTIKNLVLNYDYAGGNYSYSCNIFGGLCCQINTTSSYGVTIENITIDFDSGSYVSTSSSTRYCGGLVGKHNGANNLVIRDCTTTKLSWQHNSPLYFGGIIGYTVGATIDRCQSNLKSSTIGKNPTSDNKYIGGIVGYASLVKINDCYFNGEIETKYNESNVIKGIGGILGYGSAYIANCLFQGSIQFGAKSGLSVYTVKVGGICGANNCSTAGYKSIVNCISNGTIKNTSTSVKAKFAGGVITPYGATGTGALSELVAVYNTKNHSPNNVTTSSSYGTNIDSNLATSDTLVKSASTYASWTDFSSHWSINENINNGYPMLAVFTPEAQVTGFEGSGSSASPYLISTQSDMIAFANYYNNNPKTISGVYWKLNANIDMAKNASNVLIHFAPVCYNGTFDGYFDGNSKTISGLLIDKQYQYTGLFGTIASGSYVKNLTVNGTIYWDQTYAVGGVAGRVMAGGYLQNCVFNGNIIGVLNTKSSTECHGVVGKYEIGGANNCSATYIELKYAKIGGTTTAPTYTYYLYDWSQITTRLYNSLV